MTSKEAQEAFDVESERMRFKVRIDELETTIAHLSEMIEDLVKENEKHREYIDYLERAI